MRGGLVGDGIGPDAAPHQFGKNVGSVAEQADRHRLAVAACLLHDRQRLVETRGLAVEITGAQAHLDPRRLAFDGEAGCARHYGRERLGAAHAAKSRGQKPLAPEVAAIMLAAEFDEGLVGPLNDALGADVDPGARRHLAEHHQALAVEQIEVLPVGPVRHQIGIGDQHAWRVGMGAKHPDRLAGLHQQGFIAFEPFQSCDDAIETFPVARGAADAAIDDEFARLFPDLGIEIVHQHAHRSFRLPRFGGKLIAARGADDAGIVDAGHGRKNPCRRGQRRPAATACELPCQTRAWRGLKPIR